HIHEDEIRHFAHGHVDALLTIGRHDDLKAFALQAAREHVAIHLIVFDEQNLGHCLAPPTNRPQRRAASDAAAALRGSRSEYRHRWSPPWRSPCASRSAADRALRRPNPLL